jgi:hypothetical protein
MLMCEPLRVKPDNTLYFYHYLANKVLTFASNLLTNLDMTDVRKQIGFRRSIA